MKRKLSYGIPLLLAMFAAFGMYIGTRFAADYKKVDKSELVKVRDVLRIIDNHYVDTPNNELISIAAIKAMLGELDPHSVYINADNLKISNERLDGNFEGVGIEFSILNDTLIVVTPISGGPSDAVGIKPGDRLIKVDNKNVAGVGITNEDVFKLLRGAKGTKVIVSILRFGKMLQFNLIRGKIPIYSLDASYMAAPGIGYIKINRFASTTLLEYKEAIKKLKSQGLNNLILDLRGNPGGYLTSAIDLADEFLIAGNLIVFTKGRERKKEEFLSTKMGEFESGKLVVIIDEGSASASEIVSGALQDLDRAIIIGRRSFGKGLVQEPFSLPDGSGIRLTVARYYTPNGRSIQRPFSNGTKDYYDVFSHRFQDGELTNKDSVHYADSLKYRTIGGRIVYGGGGIMPDVFVPLDNSFNTVFAKKVSEAKLINSFVLLYLNRHRDAMNSKFKNFESFDSSFLLAGPTYQQFLKYASGKGITVREKGYKESEKYIQVQLKALFARSLFGDDAFFREINIHNSTYIEALELFSSDAFSKLGIKY